MPEPREAEQSVLMDLEPGSGGSVRPGSSADKTFRRYDQDQPMLLAPDLRDWIPADHPARSVHDLVEHGWTWRRSMTTTPRLAVRRRMTRG